ncbi:MAG: glycoside hydrolase family 28 protein [Terriglobales bacterium]
MLNRREFSKALIVTGGAILAGSSKRTWAASRNASSESGVNSDSRPWDQVSGILYRIKPPTFPDRIFDITKFGAIGDNKTENTDAFSRAIAACANAGGGQVLLPAGEFLSAAIHLKTNVNLHLSNRAVLRFTRDPAKYPIVLTRFEGVELMNFSPFIYAFEQDNIAITGSGTIDGNADASHWWDWKSRTRSNKDPSATPNDRDVLFRMAESGRPVNERVFGEGHYLRPQFIQPYRCKNVLIEGVTLLNSPMWQIHPVLCTNVTVRSLNINADGPNTDGCDPESCTDVLIDNCTFNTSDDCIAIKSGRNADGRRIGVPSQNIVVRNCQMKNGHGGVTIGSEISGGVRDVFADNCQMDSPHLDNAIRIKNNAMRGGKIENIYARNINVGEVAAAAVSTDYFYEEGKAGQFVPIVQGVSIEKLTTRKSNYAVFLRGFENDPIRRVDLIDCDFNRVQERSVVENVTGVSLRNVRINGKPVQRLS